MTIKEIVKKYSNELRFVPHIPAKEVEILMMFLLDKNTIWLHLNYEKEFETESPLLLTLSTVQSMPISELSMVVNFWSASVCCISCYESISQLVSLS